MGPEGRWRERGAGGASVGPDGGAVASRVSPERGAVAPSGGGTEHCTCVLCPRACVYTDVLG